MPYSHYVRLKNLSHIFHFYFSSENRLPQRRFFTLSFYYVYERSLTPSFATSQPLLTLLLTPRLPLLKPHFLEKSAIF